MRNLKLNTKYQRLLFYQHRRMLYLLLVVFGFAYPLILFISQPNWMYENFNHLSAGSETYFPIFQIPFISIIMLFIAAFVVIYVVFSYTNNKANMDNYLSFPISKENLFLNQFFFSFLLIFIPFAIMWISGWGVGKLLYQPHYSWMLEHAGENYTFFEMLGQLGMIGLFLPVFLGIAMFALVNTPSLADGALYGMSLHVLPYFIYYSMTLLSERYIWGFNSTAMEESIVGKLRFDSVFFENLQSENLVSFNFDLSYIVWIGLGLVLVFINMKLFAKRPVESIGTNKVNNWFYPVITNLGTYLLLVVLLESFVLSSYNNDFKDYLYPLVAGFIFYFILDMIRNRGLSKIVRMTVIYLSLFALAVGTFFAMDLKVGHWLSRVETRTNLKSVEIRSYTELLFLEPYTVSHNQSGQRYYGNHYKSTEAELIDLVKEIQRRSFDLYFDYFGNRLGSDNDPSYFHNLLGEDSAYQYYRQQHPFLLSEPISQYFKNYEENFYRSDDESIDISFLFVDEHNQERKYDYRMPIEWLDEIIIELTPGI